MIKQKYKQHKETIDNFFWRALQVISKQGITFIIFFVSAYFLTPEEFGSFNYLMAVVALLIIVSDFGLSSATSKYIAEHKATESKELNKILFSTSLTIVIASTIVSLFLIIFGNFIFNDNYFLILLFIPYIYFLPLSSLLDGVYRGLKEFKKLSLISLFVGLFSLLISFALVYYFSLYGAIVSQNLLYLLLTIILFVYYKEKEYTLTSVVLKKIIKYALVIGFANLAFYFYSRVDMIILEKFGYTVEIGYYGIVDKIFQLLFVPAVILGQVIAPNVSALVAKNKLTDIKKQYKKLLLPIFFGAIILSIALYFILPLVIQSFFPKYYSLNFILILNILLILLPFKFWGVFATNGFIVPSGFAKIIMITTFIGGAFNVVLDIIFINLYGFIGVFWVTLIVHSLNIAVQTIYFLKKQNEN